MTGAPEDRPAGSQPRGGRSWRRAFSLLCGGSFPNRGALCAPEQGTDPLPLLLQAPSWTRVEDCVVLGSPGYAFCTGSVPRAALCPRTWRCGSGDNLGRACGKQPLGCRLFAFVDSVPEARPFLPGAVSFLQRASERLRAAFAACSRGRRGRCAGTLWFLTPAATHARPEYPARLAGLCKPLYTVSATCNRRSLFSLGILRFATPPPI